MNHVQQLAAAPFAVLLLFASPAGAEELTAQQIVDRALDTDTLGFQTGQVTMTLIIQDDTGESRERQLLVRGANDDGQSRALVRVVAPAEQAGQSYLFRENASGEDDVYVFMPALDAAPRRISGNSKNGSFMGTHFTYADLETRDVRDSTYTRLPDERIGQFDVFVIDAIPNNLADSEYGRVRLWIRQSDNIPLRTRFFGADGEAVKTLFTEETAVDGERVYVRRLTLRPARGGATTMILDDVDFGAVVSPAELTPQNLAN